MQREKEMDLKSSKVTRKGPITIITLSRPEVYNALHIDAHFELNKVWLTGLVVFGPVGAIAGAAVGYTAGHGIARSWGLSRPPYRPARNLQRDADSSASSVPVPRSKPVDTQPLQRRPY